MLCELIVSPEMLVSAYLRRFADVAALGELYNSQLVMSRGKRFESARRLSLFSRPLSTLLSGTKASSAESPYNALGGGGGLRFDDSDGDKLRRSD